MDDCRNPDINTISHETLSHMMRRVKDYLIVDCRFDYEYEGGHIRNALNLNTPEAMETYFFSSKDAV